MNIQHAMNCKKGGYITIRHNDLRDLTANRLTKICKDVNIKPQLLLVRSETFNNRTANTSREARVDLKSRVFWVKGQQAFFDVRVFDPNANRYLNKALPQCHIQKWKREEMTIHWKNFKNWPFKFDPPCTLNLWWYGKRLWHVL